MSDNTKSELAKVPSQMRALTLDGVGFDHLAVRKVPTPRPNPDQMLARVEAAGICTSLIKLVEQGPRHKYLYGWDVAHFPLILGDEGAVRIVEVGSALQAQYRAGETFVIQPAEDHPPIHHRERYRDGARGIEKVAVGYTLGGHLAEYILITEEILRAGCLLPIPGNMPLAYAAMSEPLSCIVSAQDHHIHLVQKDPLAPREATKGLKPGGVTVIVGAGAMGRMHVDLAFSYRPRAIVVADLVEPRLELVRSLFGPRAGRAGIDLQAINVGSVPIEQVVAELTGHTGADDVIVAVGSKQAIESAQRLVGPGAVLNLFGGLKTGEDVVALDTGIVHYKEINVTGSSGGAPWDMARTLELISSQRVDPGAHITRIGDLDHAVDFLQMVKSQQIDGKAVVYPHRRSKTIQRVNSWSVQDEEEFLEGSESLSAALR